MTFTGLLRSYGGNRVWATLYKLAEDDTDKSDPNIEGASFVGMSLERRDSEVKATADLAHITGWAVEHGVELDGLKVESVTLEDVYLRLVAVDDEGGDA